jgi:hypothetical protein
MKAFIATSIKHKEEGLKIVKIIKDLSIEYQCCLTEEGTLEGEKLFEHNYQGILNADVFISILKDLGKDVSTEIGMAYSLNKIRIGIDYNADNTDVMPYFAAGKIVKEDKLQSVLEYCIKNYKDEK